jgi:hypothetical protein
MTPAARKTQFRGLGFKCQVVESWRGSGGSWRKIQQKAGFQELPRLTMLASLEHTCGRTKRLKPAPSNVNLDRRHCGSFGETLWPRKNLQDGRKKAAIPGRWVKVDSRGWVKVMVRYPGNPPPSTSISPRACEGIKRMDDAEPREISR